MKYTIITIIVLFLLIVTGGSVMLFIDSENIAETQIYNGYGNNLERVEPSKIDLGSTQSFWVVSISGNESKLYDVNLERDYLCIEPKFKSLSDLKDGVQIEECLDKTCKTETYIYSDIPITKSKNSKVFDDFIRKEDLTSSSDLKLCYYLNYSETTFYKFGYESITALYINITYGYFNNTYYNTTKGAVTANYSGTLGHYYGNGSFAIEEYLIDNSSSSNVINLTTNLTLGVTGDSVKSQLYLTNYTKAGLVGAYFFDTMTGRDSSGYDNHGNPLGDSGVFNPIPTCSYKMGCFSSKGYTYPRFVVPKQAQINNLQDFTYSLWFNATSAGNGNLGHILEKDYLNGYYVYLDGVSPRLHIYIEHATTDLNYYTDYGIINFHNWNHLAISYNSSGCNGLKVYLNNTIITGTCVGGTGARKDDSGKDLFFSERNIYNRGFFGQLDDILIYNRTLTQGEVSNIYGSRWSLIEGETLNQGSVITMFNITNETSFVQPSYIITSNPSSSNWTVESISVEEWFNSFEGGEPPANSCSYTSGDWNVNCYDNCTITDNVNLGGNTFNLRGGGTFTLLANITNYNTKHYSGASASNVCTVRIGNGGGFK